MENKLGFGEQSDKGHAPNIRFAAMLADEVAIGCKSVSASVSAGRSLFSFSC